MITRCLTALLILSIAFLSSVHAASADRGQLLYNNFCYHCHISEIHYRVGSKISNWAELVHMVSVWQEEMKLGWTAEDVTDVASWLDWVYYQLPDAQGAH
jgi:hypothetical protein